MTQYKGQFKTSSPATPAVRNGQFAKTVVASAVLAFMVSACGSDDDDDSGVTGIDNPGVASPGTASGNYAVSQNDGVDPGNVQFFTDGLDTTPVTVNSGANEGVAFDAAGTLYQNSDADGAVGIRAIGQAATLSAMSEFTTASGRLVGSTAGKGLTYISAGDLLVSADVTGDTADLKIYSSTAGADAAPLFTVDTAAPVWDVFYEENTDRLYAALTNGVLAIFDEFSVNVGSQPTRQITPVGDDGVQASVNFHGVFVENGTILVTDVGSAESATDGALFTFAEDGVVDGETTAFTMIAGPLTMLGNPVDAILDGGSAIVAEKSNDQILTFDNITQLTGDVSADASTVFSKPESIEFSVAANEAIVDGSDLDSATTLDNVIVALNPTPAQDDGSGTIDNSQVGVISLLGSNLDTPSNFNAGSVIGDPGAQSFRTLENVQVDSAGNAYAVFDTTNGTDVTERGMLVIHQIAARGEGTVSGDQDRQVTSIASGLTSPKGIELVESMGIMIVADVGNDGTPASLQVFSTSVGGEADPMFTVSNTGNAAIWDMDYDPSTDRLYAAGTAGDILVYDDFMASAESAVPTRSIQPSTAAVTSNMHGIVHVASSDQLIVTDVGDAASAEDGKLYVIDSAMTTMGSVAPAATVSGPESMLGNPVDLAFDGSNAYIAEKSNNALLVYTDVLSLSGDLMQAPDQSVSVANPESVALIPADDS